MMQLLPNDANLCDQAVFTIRGFSPALTVKIQKEDYMLELQLISSRRTIAFFIPTIFLVAFFLFNKAVSIFTDWDGLPTFALVAIPLLLFVAAIAYFLIKRRFEKVLSCVLAIIACYIFLYEINLNDYIGKYLEQAKFDIFIDYYHDCSVSAIDIGKGEKLRICEKRIFDNGLLYSDLPYTTEIIYDSSDQILLPSEQRSPEWTKAAHTLGLQQDFNVSHDNRYIPKTKDVFGATQSLGHHFYYVVL